MFVAEIDAPANSIGVFAAMTVRPWESANGVDTVVSGCRAFRVVPPVVSRDDSGCRNDILTLKQARPRL